MKFKQHLKEILEQMSRKNFCSMTGVPASSLSIWLNSDVEPSRERQEQIARSLGLEADYFGALVQRPSEPKTSFTPLEASKLMGVGVQFIYNGLQQRVFPWGYAVNRDGNWSYWINKKKFYEIEGFNDDDENGNTGKSESNPQFNQNTP